MLAMARRLRGPSASSIRFEGTFDTWESAAARSRGYDDQVILARALEAVLKVKSGEVAYERDSVLFDEIEYSWPALAGLMWAAARNGGVLEVLDFGGALGSTYFQNRKFLQHLPSVRWRVVEQAQFVEAGRAYVQDDRLRFHASVQESMTEHAPNVILLSGVLQYIADPYGLLAALLASRSEIVILDRTCYVKQGNPERIAVQHVPASIHRASYPCRFMVEGDVLATFISAGYRLVEEFDALDTLDASATWKGHIFLRLGATE